MKVRVEKSVLEGCIKASPSKSYTHRAIIISSLCNGVSIIKNPLISRDTNASISGCTALGASIALEDDLKIQGNSQLKTPDDIINVENSGTTLRFLSSLAALPEKGYVVLTGDSSIRNRPMQPLIDALTQLGVPCWSTRLNGCAPIIIKCGGIKGGSVEIDANISSQFISSLLISSPFAKESVKIKINGHFVSHPYVLATIEVMKVFGIKILGNLLDHYEVYSGQKYYPTTFNVPGDFSSSAFILAGAFLSGGKVTITGLNFDLPQGDSIIMSILSKIGAIIKINSSKGTITVESSDDIKGGEFDLSNTPDLLPIVAILGCKSRSEFRITGVEHARFKETNRISVLANELPKLGVKVKELNDGLIIRGEENLRNCILDSHGDHRMAMAFSVIGMSSEMGCWVNGFQTIDISYPKFRNDVESLGGIIKEQ